MSTIKDIQAICGPVEPTEGGLAEECRSLREVLEQIATYRGDERANASVIEMRSLAKRALSNPQVAREGRIVKGEPARDLLGCPWCGSMPVLSDLCDEKGKYGKGYSCKKGNCCCGPVRQSEREARKAWNSRSS